ncbi:enoyl-CoA hydratase [Spongisporangium articulatum]|uniref:Enoyl-CoA hydratase n=1 Tax=Spongisporangium articulatum TaxID=3362603 RepID=A0ABW8AT89_9ACTN
MIGIEERGAVTVLRIERHAQRNALNAEHARGLLDAATKASQSGARCLVITGEGSTFCAGADLDTVRDPGFTRTLADLLQGLVRLPIPVIAGLNGPAIGAGCQLAIACDLRVGAPTVRFSVPTVRLGLALDAWSIQRLISLIGGGPSRALLLGADTLEVQRAYNVGLVDRLGEVDAAIAWAEEIAAMAPLAMTFNKLALNRLVATGDAHPDVIAPDDAVEASFDVVWGSDDSWEGLRARADRRQPNFQGK